MKHQSQPCTAKAYLATGPVAGGKILSDAERFARLRLIRSPRVGAVNFHRLIEAHGNAGAVLAQLPDLAAAAGVAGYQPCDPAVIAAELARGAAMGAVAIFHGEAAYPRELAELADAPALLWAKGDLACLAQSGCAVVGARNASALGLRMARRMAGALAEAGLAIVSGLARGIDAAAHEAALPRQTIAVLAGGVDEPWPEENRDLAARIADGGLLLAEHPPGIRPQARHFVQRNRIISGLALGVLVVEAAARSGSLITARSALDQGREVMAVPGHPFDARAAGCNMLLRDGAALVRGPTDVLEVLAPVAQRRGQVVAAISREQAAEPEALSLRKTSLRRALGARAEAIHRRITAEVARPVSPQLREASRLHGLILARLGASPVSEDQLLRELELPAAQVSPELLLLELEGQVLRHPGGLVSRSCS